MSSVPDSFDFTAIPDDDSLDAGAILKEGTFHFVVEAIDKEHVSKTKGTHGIESVLQVLAGTEKSEKGKKLYERFYYPTPDQKDGGVFATQRICKFARVLDLISEADLGKKGVVIPWDKAVARQFIATVAYNYDEKDIEKKKPLGSQIDGLKMFRVNDDDVAEIPKDEAALAMLGVAGQGSEATAKPTEATSISDM